MVYPQGETCEYEYAPAGERMKGEAWPCDTTSFNGYDRDPIGFEDLTAEYDASGNEVVRFVHGPGIDQPIWMVRGEDHYAYHTDALGSITTLTNETGASIRSYTYDAFGVITSESGNLPNNFTFTGRERNSGSAMYYYRARTYDPGIGRFISRDPAGFVNGPNVYVYAGNSPVNFVDPSGLYFEGCWGWECALGGDGNGGGGRGGGAGAANGADCLLEWTIFGIGLALSLVGFGIATHRVKNIAGSVVRGTVEGGAAASHLVLSVSNLIRSGLSVGSLGDILSIAWIVITEFILPNLGWLDALSFGAQAAAKLNPALASMSFAIVILSATFGLANLHLMGC